MKSSLKRSEIIEQLKRVLSVTSIEIVKQSVLHYSNFYRVYVLLVRYVQGNTIFYHVISITLNYGWIQLEIGDVDTVGGKSELLYLDEILSQAAFIKTQFT